MAIHLEESSDDEVDVGNGIIPVERFRSGTTTQQQFEPEEYLVAGIARDA